MPDIDNKRGWVDMFYKITGGLGVFIASILIPLVLHWNSEKNSNNQLYAQIVSERERADADLRARMFENLIKSFFGDTSKDSYGKKRITMLRLLSLNFHESFDLKPLFEELDYELKGDNREELRRVAKEVTEKQEATLSQVKEGVVFNITFEGEGEENGKMIPPSGKEAYESHRLGIVVTEIGKDDDYVKLHITDMPEGNAKIASIADLSFKLTYYDMPFIDNTKLFNNTRFAVTLKGIGKDDKGNKFVNVKLIFFPETYMSGRDRPYLDEMLAQLRQGK